MSRPPNEMDHLFDTRSAFRRFEHNFNRWMNIDFDVETGQTKRATVPLVEEKGLAARRAARALVDLKRQAHFMIEFFIEHGWVKIKPKVKAPPKTKILRANEFKEAIERLTSIAARKTKKAKRKR
jgi:hypothetical protein